MRVIADRLACVRGGRRLFEDLSFAVAPGEALLLLGPNGAGKSSLLRLVAGLLRPAAGSVVLDGAGAEESPGAAVHFLAHSDAVKGALTVAENLSFWRSMLSGNGDIGVACTRMGLGAFREFPARILSAGQRRRLGLARLLVARRPLWLLDEPTTALDREGQELFRTIAQAHLTGGGMILAATHAALELAPAREIRLGAGGSA